MSKLVQRTAIEEVAKRLKLRAMMSPIDLKELMFDKQYLAFTSPKKRIVILCSRRAGKTTGCLLKMVNTVKTTHNITIAYVTVNKSMAKRILWPNLKRVLDEQKISYKANNVELTITTTSGSMIYLLGAKDDSAKETIRGMSLYTCFIDEAQYFRDYLASMITEVIEPALLDYDGQLFMIGTPGPLKEGVFYHTYTHGADLSPEEYEEFKFKKWEAHHWTFMDNYHLATKSGKSMDKIYQDLLEEKQMKETDATFRREYKGEWVEDTDSLVFKFDRKINTYSYDDITFDKSYEYIMGIDLGFNDASAIAILAYSHKDPVVYLVEEWLQDKVDITTIAQAVKELNKKYNCISRVCDEGGLGKLVAEEMRTRHGINIVAAEKSEKLTFIEFFNAASIRGKFKAFPGAVFGEDSRKLHWMKTRQNKFIINPSFHSDMCDAVLYAFRECRSYIQEVEIKEDKTTEEYLKKQEEDIKNKIINKLHSSGDDIFEQEIINDLDGDDIIGSHQRMNSMRYIIDMD